MKEEFNEYERKDIKHSESMKHLKEQVSLARTHIANMATCLLLLLLGGDAQRSQFPRRAYVLFPSSQFGCCSSSCCHFFSSLSLALSCDRVIITVPARLSFLLLVFCTQALVVVANFNLYYPMGRNIPPPPSRRNVDLLRSRHKRLRRTLGHSFPRLGTYRF